MLLRCWCESSPRNDKGLFFSFFFFAHPNTKYILLSQLVETQFNNVLNLCSFRYKIHVVCIMIQLSIPFRVVQRSLCQVQCTNIYMLLYDDDAYLP